METVKMVYEVYKDDIHKFNYLKEYEELKKHVRDRK